ncbi:hypothetical protein B5S28_g4525 [[Candida] boidinii]|uniref:Unnamed protein product n=1 Tax=Candida boidinii TaxID=5477 RepID=A0ACB5TEU9_CANBO|nr:hypothetical protein B5S28_g4525 [[Candida] boidinii]OWB63957.1 hypothetical protein B5S29_g4979 [[Candida] boidinii]OWB75111.1 hypothetical protein B5S31_g4968 [[Candida] boidinii]OWB78135.1 hypothetical protein B5S32_g2321 [[Candida] boidinii]GME87483.1 unnamed protein product [[Candida] boidinii]
MWFGRGKKEDDSGNKTNSQNGDSSDEEITSLTNVLTEAAYSKSGVSSPEEFLKQQRSNRELANKRVEDLELSKFPKEMSCFTAWSEVMECMSIGGQVRHYYRYGDLTTCDKETDKLNFCLKNSLTTGEVREKAIQEFYKQTLQDNLKRGSSEDIWEAKDV